MSIKETVIFFSLTSPKSEIMEEDCKKFFVQLGYMASGLGFDKFDDTNVDKTSTIDQDKIVLGVSYKF